MGKVVYDDKTNRIPPTDPDKQITAEDLNVLKESVNILYVRLVDDNVVKFYGDSVTAATPVDNDYRVAMVGAYLCFDRYDSAQDPGSEWVQQFQIGGSAVVPDGITITKGNYSGDLVVSDATGFLVAMSAGIFERSLFYSDFNGSPTIMGIEDVFKGTKTRDNVQADIQSGNAYEITGTEFWTDSFTTFVNTEQAATFFQTNYLKFQPIDIPVNNLVRIQVFEHPNYDEGDQLWENVSAQQLVTGDGNSIVEVLEDLQDSGVLTVDRHYEVIATTVDYFGSGVEVGDRFTATSALALSGTNSVQAVSGTILISPGFRGPGGRTLKISVTSVEDITLKCNDVLGVDLTISSIDEEGRQDAIPGYPKYVEEATYTLNISTVYEGGTIYVCNTTGAQTGSFASNAALWDEWFYIPYINCTLVGDDKGLTITEQLSVGTPGEPKETVLGGGDSYPVPIAYHCNIANTTGMVITSATDVSTILQTDSDSTVGLFDGTSAGKYILVGSDYKFSGVKVKMSAAGVVEAANVRADYLKDTDVWVRAYYMATDADYPYAQHGNQLAECSSCSEQWFFGFDPLNLPTIWDKTTMTINGSAMEKYWAKFEITSAITTDPVIEQIKLHTNAFEIEADGSTSYRGIARYPKSIPITIEANADKTPLSENIDIADGVTVVRVFNEFADVKVDGNILSGIIPVGLDTSIPVTLHVDWYPSNNNTGDVELEVELVPVTNGFVFDGTADKLSTIPAVHSVSNDQYVKHTSIFQALVQQSLPGDQVFVSLFRDATSGNTEDTYAGNIVITNIVLVGYFWK